MPGSVRPSLGKDSAQVYTANKDPPPGAELALPIPDPPGRVTTGAAKQAEGVAVAAVQQGERRGVAPALATVRWWRRQTWWGVLGG